MSNVIDFLEQMGRDARLRYAASDEIRSNFVSAQIDPALHAALLGGDSKRLEALLGARTDMCPIIFPVQEDEADTTQPTSPVVGRTVG